RDLVVTRIEEGLPAKRAGIRKGWILKKIGATSTTELKQKTPEKLDDRRRDFLAWRAASKKISGSPDTPVELEFVDGQNRSVKRTIRRTTAQGEPIQFGTLP